ncbi:DMT family transporter [Alkaliphilus peptidifermentans]|uniref:Threonine/homoserine efflux transporter RhtA n=1 Tax=Alkaliphilus peptidifermentans DSM 18978 TaxID=1120976 RepID=A0A1G5FXG5_9FIRM|nr:DMT family transporter [Alkaliphilus peptidifermentans]SCY43530.1 Threonine/homoserine efflux transporter RhtA [Alkaliphilus peptidifermentans DSM 18978]
MNDRKKALIYLVITAVLWSTGGLLIKLVEWNPLAIAGARSGIAAIIMLIYLKRPIRSIDRIKLLGAISYGLLVILFIAANKLTTSANAILLQFTAPIWVILFAKAFLKEKTYVADWLTIIAVILGMTLFFIGGLKSGNILGNTLAVLSGMAMAAMIIFLKIKKEDSPIEITLLGNIITFFIGLPFILLSAPPSNTSIIAILILGVFQLGISYILYVNAVRHVSAVDAILIPIIEPLLNPIWVFVFAGEAPGKYAILGGSIVILSIITRSIYQQKITKVNLKQEYKPSQNLQ